MMKTTLLLATMATALATPAGLANTELESLRALCAEQESQIRLLEEENRRLRSLAEGTRTSLTASASRTPSADQAAPAPAAARTYRVKAGDTLAKIARQHGATASQLAKLNGIKDPGLIRPGQELKLPGDAPAASSSAPATAPSRTDGATHMVRAGDTFYSIARAHGTTVEALVAANPKVKPSALRPGQAIQLGGAATASREAAAPRSESSLPSPDAASPADAPASKPVIRSVTIDGEMTYGEFAARHGSDVQRLNDLNGLDLDTSTVLAKGSELYIPAQP